MRKVGTWVGVAAGVLCSSCLVAADGWSETTWNGERAVAADSEGWRAVVSLERGRLVHFGPADAGENLLHVSTERGPDGGWGGHIAWLGPQIEWPAIWPPLAAWERSAAVSHAVRDGWLELALPESGGGWARLTRAYRWDGDALLCRVSVTGGAHAAQVMQIVQVPASAVVRVVQAVPSTEAPSGFYLLRVGVPDQVVREFSWPAHAVREADGALTWRPTGTVIKVGFAPQPLVATIGAYELSLAPAGETGVVAGAIDGGYTTQLYLGREGTPFIELEQLSSRFAAGADASATMRLSARRLP
jgi:hypothetical protein